MPREDPPLCPLCNEPTKAEHPITEEGWKPWLIGCWDCRLEMKGRPGESLAPLMAKWNELLGVVEIRQRAAAVRKTWHDDKGVMIPFDERKLPVFPATCDTCEGKLPDGVTASRCAACCEYINSGRRNEDRVCAYLETHGRASAAAIARKLGADATGVLKTLRGGEDKRFWRSGTKARPLWEAIP
ncbi:hypothetical protein LCGC14_1355740 [marine sediment metagenome]|uniref:Uncharacterized protein n=1 Tax=marine sediment metagenome TaxID=412755 RepID=A0A0F9K9J3_9ZZZZ